jgi:hypothetical protein
MSITLPLEPRKEAKLIALTKSKGVSADELVREAIDKILGGGPRTRVQERTFAFHPRHSRQVRPRTVCRGDRQKSRGNVRQFSQHRPLMVVAIADTHAIGIRTIW